MSKESGHACGYGNASGSGIGMQLATDLHDCTGRGGGFGAGVGFSIFYRGAGCGFAPGAGEADGEGEDHNREEDVPYEV